MSKPPPDQHDLSPRAYWAAVGGALVLFSIWLTNGLGRPWIGTHDWNGAAWSTAARHLIERPLAETRLGVSLDHGSGPLDPKAFYVHHPPLVVWLLAGAYKLFGVSESVGRLVPAVFTIVGAFCLAGLATALGDRRAGLCGLAVFLAMPAQLYYGRMPNHEPIALPLMIAAAWATVAWTRRPTPPRLFLCLLAVTLACLSSWAPFFFAAALGLTALRGTPNGRTLFGGVAAASAAVLGFLIWHIRFVRADGWTDLLAAFFLRSGGVGVGEWLGTMAHWLSRLLTPIGAGAVLLHAVRLVRPPAGTELAILPLVAAGWANVLIFRQGAFVHEYYAHFLGAPAALIAGLVLAREGTKHTAGFALGAAWLSGLLVASGLRNEQSKLYASGVPESPRFVVELGKKIADAFPADAKLLVDVAPIGEHLAFYADRRMVYLAQTTEADLPKVVAGMDGVVGNTRLAATRELLDRVLALGSRRVAGRREFTVEGHTFLAVTLSRD